MNVYEFEVGEFKGPIDKLLELIESKNMEITRLNLASVTSDFLDYIRNLREADSKTISDFISVASQLILIKSHALLPNLELNPDEEKSIEDLERRLATYREFRLVEKKIAKLWEDFPVFSREFVLGEGGGFYLSDEVTPRMLFEKIGELVKDFQSIMPKYESHKIKLINFEEKVKELIGRIEKTISSSFNEITKGRERSEVIVMFLALLHLLKDSLIKINQENAFSDIEITKIN